MGVDARRVGASVIDWTHQALSLDGLVVVLYTSSKSETLFVVTKVNSLERLQLPPSCHW